MCRTVVAEVVVEVTKCKVEVAGIVIVVSEVVVVVVIQQEQQQ